MSLVDAQIADVEGWPPRYLQVRVQSGRCDVASAQVGGALNGVGLQGGESGVVVRDHLEGEELQVGAALPVIWVASQLDVVVCYPLDELEGPAGLDDDVVIAHQPVGERHGGRAVVARTHGKLAEVQTRVHLTYDSENLYLGFHCDEPEPSSMGMDSEKPSQIWARKDDKIAAMIQAGEQEKTYDQCALTAGGLKYDQKCSPKGKVLFEDSRWEAAVSTGKDFWEAEYPAIRDVEENTRTIADTGCELAGHFTLPESAWYEHYYQPLEKRLVDLRRRYQDDDEALELIEVEEAEIDLYRKYSDYYGYVFYVMRRKQNIGVRYKVEDGR